MVVIINIIGLFMIINNIPFMNPKNPIKIINIINKTLEIKASLIYFLSTDFSLYAYFKKTSVSAAKRSKTKKVDFFWT